MNEDKGLRWHMQKELVCLLIKKIILFSWNEMK